jgi:hypothetical protein
MFSNLIQSESKLSAMRGAFSKRKEEEEKE